MDVGFLGLGQMGAAIAERLETSDVRLHVFDPNPVAVAPFVLRGAVDSGVRRCGGAGRADRVRLPAAGAVSEQVAAEVAGSPALRIYVEMSTIGSPTHGTHRAVAGSARHRAGGLPDQRRAEGCARRHAVGDRRGTSRRRWTRSGRCSRASARTCSRSASARARHS